MRHRLAGRALGRSSSHRQALIRNQITDLLRHDRIVTTEAKAKTLRPAAERVITLGKRGTLHARRQAAATLTDKRVLRRLFNDVAPRFANRRGGYTRIVKLGPRKGDGARMALIELVDGPPPAARTTATATTAAAAPAPATAEPESEAAVATAAAETAVAAPDEETAAETAEDQDAGEAEGEAAEDVGTPPDEPDGEEEEAEAGEPAAGEAEAEPDDEKEEP